MKTITAVELRKNMGEIFRRVQNGEEIAVTYRNSQPMIMVANKPKVQPKKGMTGLDAFLASPRKGFRYDHNKSFKELYDESLKEKYGKYIK